MIFIPFLYWVKPAIFGDNESIPNGVHFNLNTYGFEITRINDHDDTG